MDGVDAVLIELRRGGINTRASLTLPYPEAVRARLKAAIANPDSVALHEIATLHVTVGQCFADALEALLDAAAVSVSDVVAVGSHGQTLRHSPDTRPAYSWQIGDPATIAARAGVTTVADFRSTDLAHGGEGAPLLPALHASLFRVDGKDRAVLNVGGIANLTVMPGDLQAPLLGYDTGPGNCLMDLWCERHLSRPFDENGEWAAGGNVVEALLASLLSDDYLSRPAPKSTGREHYNMRFLETHLERCGATKLPARDVQATLLAYTVETVADATRTACASVPEWLGVCGGGVHNAALMAALQRALRQTQVESIAALGVDPDMIEATAFAWFAALRVAGQPVTLTTAPGVRALVLGAVYPANAPSA